MAKIGQFIDGKYEILKLIGKGGMSEVYLAMDKNLNKQWAIKEIKRKAKDKNNEIVIQSAIAEADMIKNLDHPNIVSIKDYIEEDDVIYIIEDFVEGITLNEVIKREKRISQDKVLDYSMQICNALNYLHTRNPSIIYRDMKPHNVMLKPDGSIKIIDFGIAREYSEYRKGDTVNLGTKGYAAPEQYDRDRQTDARTDIYCLGVTMYHMLTGNNPADPPYEVLPIRQVDPQLSVGLESIILKCTKANPDERYQSCSELLYALENYYTLDTVYINKQKKKLAKFITSVMICLIFLAAGITSLVFNSQTIDNQYKEYVENGNKATDYTEKEMNYTEAIKLKPAESSAYYKLIEAMKSDDIFTTSEEGKIVFLLSNKEIKESDIYGDLAYEVGKLYFYYYEIDSDKTRLKFSKVWFNDAYYESGADVSEKNVAKVYMDIAQFTEDIEGYIREASDTGKYKELFDDLIKVKDLVNTDSTPELAKLTTNRTIINQIETRVRKIKNDGLTKDEVLALFNEVYANIENTEATSDKTIELKENLLNKKAEVLREIENAYREVKQ